MTSRFDYRNEEISCDRNASIAIFRTVWDPSRSYFRVEYAIVAYWKRRSLNRGPESLKKSSELTIRYPL